MIVSVHGIVCVLLVLLLQLPLLDLHVLGEAAKGSPVVEALHVAGVDRRREDITAVLEEVLKSEIEAYFRGCAAILTFAGAGNGFTQRCRAAGIHS